MASATVPLHKSIPSTPAYPNPLPQLLQTPAGLALLELQGTINVPDPDGESRSVPIGRIDFPTYNPEALDPSSTAWMKQVYLYVGQHQRLTGEVKKLPKPLAVIRRRGEGAEDEVAEELEVVDIVKYKLVFSTRPEPVTGSSGS
jgi:chromosome transmission fidelity protein 8